jgi:hypothetical protein
MVNTPARYAGPVSGEIPVSASGASGRFAWTGNVTLALDHVGARGPGPQGTPDGVYAYYRPQAGTMHLTLELLDGNCTGTGATDIAVDPTAGEDSFVEQGVEQPTYFLYAAFGPSEIPFTWSGGTPADPCANDGTLPFGAGLPALVTGMPQRAPTSVLAGSSTNVFPGMGSVRREWSLAPVLG